MGSKSTTPQKKKNHNYFVFLCISYFTGSMKTAGYQRYWDELLQKQKYDLNVCSRYIYVNSKKCHKILLSRIILLCLDLLMCTCSLSWSLYHIHTPTLTHPYLTSFLKAYNPKLNTRSWHLHFKIQLGCPCPTYVGNAAMHILILSLYVKFSEWLESLSNI